MVLGVNAAQNDPPELVIRALHPDDDVLDGVPTPRPDTDTPQWQRTRVAIADGRIVGSASLTLAPVTDWYFCEVSLSPNTVAEVLARASTPLSTSSRIQASP
jgi:hypothetical protein